MRLTNRFIYRVLALFCLVALFSIPVGARAERSGLFGGRTDTVYVRMGETVRIWGDAGTTDSIYLYRWSTGDTSSYVDIADERLRERWVWCQRISALDWRDDATIQDTLLENGGDEPVADTVVNGDEDNDEEDEDDDDEEDDEHGGGHHGNGWGGDWEPKAGQGGGWETKAGYALGTSAPSAPSVPSTLSTPSVDTFSYNIFHIETKYVWAGLSDVVRFTTELDSVNYPEEGEYEFTDIRWTYGDTGEHYSETVSDSAVLDFTFDGRFHVMRVSASRRTEVQSLKAEPVTQNTVFIFWGISPTPVIETDSVLIIYPQYARSDLGGDTVFCLSYTDTLPAASDTILSYNLGPANRDLYVSYRWIWKDTVAGEDSVFYCTFGMLDTVKENVYQGRLLVRAAVDTVVYGEWVNETVRVFDSIAMDSISLDTLLYRTVREFCDSCFNYDTVNIKLIRNAYPEGRNVFLPYDSLLCAHLDITLAIPDTDYHFWWLDKNSVGLPYGDTAVFTFHGEREVDSVGGGTDTLEKVVRYYLKYIHNECLWERFDTLDIIHLVQPQVAIPFHDTTICREVPIDIPTSHNLVYMDAYAYNWTGEANETGTGECDFGDVSEVEVALGGNYIVEFFHRQSYDICGYDTARDTVRILWVDPVMTDILLPGDTGMCPNLYIVLNAKNDFDSTRYEWRLNPPPDSEDDSGLDETADSVISTKPKIRVEEELTLYITLTDTMQCSYTQEVKIHIEDCTPKIEIPNVFTPNGDGINDTWKFKVLEKCVDVKIVVVNRWGNPVLETKVADAQSFEWNGCLNNSGRPLPDGPYFYMVSYKNMYGKRRAQSGSVSILGSSER